MDEEDQYLDFSYLPDSVANQISAIILPYFEFFSKEISIRLAEINKIPHEKTRLTALVDLHNEADRSLKKYQKDYKYFLDGLENCHLSSRFYPVHSYFEGDSTSRKVSPKSEIPHSIEYMEFWTSEVDFKIKLDEIIDAARELRIKLEIAEKYNIKRQPEKKPREVIPIDINEEFLKLFENRVIGLDFITLLKRHEYISDDEKWKGISNRPGELRDAFNALKDFDLLKCIKNQVDSLKIFYERFGLTVHKYGRQGYISERALRNHEVTKDYDNFMIILKVLVPPHK